MKMVSDARQAWRWHSTQALAVLAVVPMVWMDLPPELRDYIPEAWRVWIMVSVAIGGIVGRVRDQGGAE